MRYIGCKTNLLSEIDSFLDANIRTVQKSFCDIFSGTTAVARYFKNRYKIISNDILYFSYIMQKAYIENNKMPLFKNLQSAVGNPFLYLENNSCENEKNYFVAEHFSPYGKDKRMYFTEENAKRIDFIRNTIDCWKKENKLTEDEYYYLLASLIEAVPSVSNITGTYGAYLKQWDKRAFKKIVLPQFEVIDNGEKNEVYNEDIFDLLPHISGDILYIDPPYNSRQYAPNYHVLETIARFDNPKLTGVTGMRPYENQKSVFCSKADVNDAFELLVKKADFTHILVSYSSSGLMSEDFIAAILKSNGISSTFSIKKIPYRKYKSKIYDKNEVCEYLFYIQKKEGQKINFIRFIPKNMELASVVESGAKYSRYIKSPLNYIGGKYKLLSQIVPLFPQEINMFLDLFCGGCNVGINVPCKKIIFNDINTILTEMFEEFRKTSIPELLQAISTQINTWNLTLTNEAGFKAFREHYNRTRNPIELYTLSCYSFNYQFRFNNNHEYNNPFGRNRSHFSETMRSNLVRFVEKLHSCKAKFMNFDFAEFPIDNLGENDFVYCDPPYLITTGSYNDGNRGFKDWTENSERKLYDFLDKLNEKKIRFALSNVLEHKGKSNDILKEWAKKYKIIHLDKNYSNSSYNTKRLESDEVLIVNYEVEK